MATMTMIAITGIGQRRRIKPDSTGAGAYRSPLRTPGVRWSDETGTVRLVRASPAIEAVAIVKRFGSTVAVDGADLTVAEGSIVALLGPSGSGKTTMLRTIAGFERPDGGTVSIGGRLVAGGGAWEEPDKRRVGMVFQDGALFPHLRVGANVGFGGPREGRVEECLELVGLAHRAASFPHELSGGERQRVALARALATEPEVVLLDEPFASLDAGLRVTLREEVATILRAAGASALFVTHDQHEALSLADTVVVMRDGRVEQTGTPEEVYSSPTSRWIAGFLGAADVLAGDAANGVATTELGRFDCDAALVGPVDVVIRPEHVTIGGDGAPPHAVEAHIVARAFHGHDQLLRLRLASGATVQCRAPGGDRWHRDDDVVVWVTGPVTVLPR
jgi:iron(III) transport system ATP-binding protein